jgi:hypothetical protein
VCVEWPWNSSSLTHGGCDREHNEPWDGEFFYGGNYKHVQRGDTAIIAAQASQGGSEGLVGSELVRLGADVNARNSLGL